MVAPDREVRNMKRDVASGILIMAGALTGVAVMSLHPTAHALLQPGAFAHQAWIGALLCRSRD